MQKKVPAEIHQMDVLPYGHDDAWMSAQLEVVGEKMGNTVPESMP